MKWLAHGVSQGVIAELRGGDFKSGFVGAVVGGLAGSASQAVTAGMRGLSTGLVMARTAAAAVLGGLTAQATGGSFADGAVSAAFVHLFNEEAKKLQPPRIKIIVEGDSEQAQFVRAGINIYKVAEIMGDIWPEGNYEVCIVLKTDMSNDNAMQSPSSEEIWVNANRVNYNEGFGFIASQVAHEMIHGYDYLVGYMPRNPTSWSLTYPSEVHAYSWQIERSHILKFHLNDDQVAFFQGRLNAYKEKLPK